MQRSLTDSDNTSKNFKNHNLRPNLWQNSSEVGLAPKKKIHFWRFRCNSFWFVEVLENGNYCILFVGFLSFKSCMTWSDYLVHDHNISKKLQMSWNHFRHFWLQKTHYFLERTHQILTPSNVSAARCRLLNRDILHICDDIVNMILMALCEEIDCIQNITEGLLGGLHTLSWPSYSWVTSNHVT